MINTDSSPTIIDCTFSGNAAKGEPMGGGMAYIFGGGMLNGFASAPKITNCTFSNNTASEGGAGMANFEVSPTITNCTFSENSLYGEGGGGMFNTGSSPVITNSKFLRNSTKGGGVGGAGMYNSEGSSPLITNCVFMENVAGGSNEEFGGNGGGMFNFNASPVMTNSTFSGNSAIGSLYAIGGAMSNEGSSPLITNCTFSGNTATGGNGASGGAILSGMSSPTITNCTFSGNSANGDGGGIVDWGSSFKIVNTIFWGNTATGRGNDIFHSDGTFTLNNNIVAPDGVFSYSEAGGSIISSDMIYTDPKLVGVDIGGSPVTDKKKVHIYKIQSDSSAKGAGLAVGATVGSAKVPAFDQRNTPRPNPAKSSQNADIGAYEYYVDISVTSVTLNKSSTTLAAGATETLTATISPSNAVYKAVEWSSSNSGVAVVSGGTVTAVGAGTATITVTTFDGGKTAGCTVTVSASPDSPDVPGPVASVSLNKTATTMTAGSTETLTATVLPANAIDKTVEWSSSNTSVATVSNGTVKAVAAGKATITVTTNDGAKKADCSVTVTATQESPTEPTKPTLPPGVPDDIIPAEKPNVVQLPENATKEEIAAAKELVADAMPNINPEDLALNENNQVSVSKELVAKLVSLDAVVPLPIFSAEVESGKTLAVGIDIFGRDLLAKKPEDVQIVKILSSTSSEFFKYVNKGSEYADKTFTITDQSGNIHKGAIVDDVKYQIQMMITEGGDFDLDNRTNGVVVDPAAIIKPTTNPGAPTNGGGGCSAGYLPFAFLFTAPLFFRKKK